MHVYVNVYIIGLDHDSQPPPIAVGALIHPATKSALMKLLKSNDLQPQSPWF